MSLCCRSTSPAGDPAAMVESGIGGSRSEERYLGQFPTVTSSVSSKEHFPSQFPTATSSVSASTSRNSVEASVWQHYRYYQSQFYRHPQYLPQYSHQYQGSADARSVEVPPTYHSSTWLNPNAHHSTQHQQSQLHLADGVGVTPAYHHFREMNGVCGYDSVY